MFDRIENLILDYGNGTLIINGEKIATPVKTVIRVPDGWDIAKLFNREYFNQGMNCPELVIDAISVLEDIQKN